MARIDGLQASFARQTRPQDAPEYATLVRPRRGRQGEFLRMEVSWSCRAKYLHAYDLLSDCRSPGEKEF